MVEEYWGTLSIYDHRDSLFQKSLILFDRIVIPVPDRPIGSLTGPELDKLQADAIFLQQHGAAIIYDWKQDEFQNWQHDRIKEALSVTQRDSLYDSRLLLQSRVDQFKPADIYEITAVPIYGAREQFSNAYRDISVVPENRLTLELSQCIRIPDRDTSLQAIVELRQRESFQYARKALNVWQTQKLAAIVGEQSERKILLAGEEFREMLARYEEEMVKGKFKKMKAVVTSVLAIGALTFAAFGQTTPAIALLSGAAPNLFTLKESMTPSWKDLRDKFFAAAGVIYEANKALR